MPVMALYLSDITYRLPIQTQLIFCDSQIRESEIEDPELDSGHGSERHTLSCHAELVSASHLMGLY